VTPRHRKFIDAMLQSSINIIVTLRSKMETVQTNNGGKKKVEKVGMKAEQREGIEYEVTTVLDLTHENLAIATKDRTRLFIEPRPLSEADGIALKQCLTSGSGDACIDGNQILDLEYLMQQAGIDIEKYCAKRGLNSLHDVQQQKFDETCEGIRKIITKISEQAQAATQQNQQAQAPGDMKALFDDALKSLPHTKDLNILSVALKTFQNTEFYPVILNTCKARADQLGYTFTG